MNMVKAFVNAANIYRDGTYGTYGAYGGAVPVPWYQYWYEPCGTALIGSTTLTRG